VGWRSAFFLFQGVFVMKAARYLDEEVAIKRGVEALLRELGPVEAMRFLHLANKRRVDGVKRHRAWQKTLDKDEFLDEVFSQTPNL